MVYDLNGNIRKLKRYGHITLNAQGEVSNYGVMDDLTYSYDMGNSSNRLMQVSDAGSKDYGFKDGATSSTEFGYDVNGNMIKDLNKGIGSIAYNHLNLPEAVNVTSNKGDGTGTISYIYDATGVKLKKTAPGNMVTEYTGNYVYKNGTLEFINHAEGYVENENNAYKYVYQYKDHLGNIRVSYDNSGSVSSPNASIVEEKNYYPFGLEHKGYNNNIVQENNYKTFMGQEEEKELGKNTYAFQWRDYDPAIGRFNKIDRFAEKYVNHSPYGFAKNNPIRYREIAGDSILSGSERQARRIERKSDRQANRLDKKADRLASKGKDIGDLRERASELRQTAQDVRDMRSDEDVWYGYADANSQGRSASDQGKPGTTGVTDSDGKTVVTMYTESNMGSRIHETRHGGQHSRGEINAVTQSSSVDAEVSAYRAQYSWDGSLQYMTHNFDQNTIFNRALLNLQQSPSEAVININSINNINTNMVLDIGEFYTDRSSRNLGTYVVPIYSAGTIDNNN